MDLRCWGDLPRRLFRRNLRCRGKVRDVPSASQGLDQLNRRCHFAHASVTRVCWSLNRVFWAVITSR